MEVLSLRRHILHYVDRGELLNPGDRGLVERKTIAGFVITDECADRTVFQPVANLFGAEPHGFTASFQQAVDLGRYLPYIGMFPPITTEGPSRFQNDSLDGLRHLEETPSVVGLQKGNSLLLELRCAHDATSERRCNRRRLGGHAGGKPIVQERT